jgi:methylmalonic aciduria homocystinuria type C protein
MLVGAGFDITHRFDAAAAAREPGLAMLASDERLGILIGNTRALWPRFTEAMRDPALAAEPDPLDRYTERQVAAAFPDARVYYAHRRHDGEFLPLQRLAVVTGLGALSASNLVIHPDYGPWLALRAVVVVPGNPPARAPIAQPCRCDASCGAALAAAQRSTDWHDWLAVRDRCSLRAWRYSDDQIRFHYEAATAHLAGTERSPGDTGRGSP